MANTSNRWTCDALAARLQAEDAIRLSPRQIAPIAAAEHLGLLRIVDLLLTAQISAEDAALRFSEIPERLRIAALPRASVEPVAA